MPAQITVRFFASLRERLGKAEVLLEETGEITVLDVWKRVSSESMPTNTLVAINQEYAAPQSLVRPGDEVAFFPPVTGG